MFGGDQVAAELVELALHFIEGFPLCRVFRVAPQMPTPLALILHKNILWRIEVERIGLRSLYTRSLSMRFCDLSAQPLNLELQLFEGGCLYFSIGRAFRIGAPLTLIWPIYPIWLFHGCKHSRFLRIGQQLRKFYV